MANEYSIGQAIVKTFAFFRLKSHWNGMAQSNDNITEGTMPDEEKMTIDERYNYLRIKHKQALLPRQPKATQPDVRRVQAEIHNAGGL